MLGLGKYTPLLEMFTKLIQGREPIFIFVKPASIKNEMLEIMNISSEPVLSDKKTNDESYVLIAFKKSK